MLTADELASMREDFDASLPDLADVLRKTEVDDGQGGTTESWTEASESVPCRVSPIPALRAIESERADRIISTTGWYITLPFGTVVYAEDRIRVTSTETEEVRTFEVNGLMDPRSFQIGTRVLASEVV